MEEVEDEYVEPICLEPGEKTFKCERYDVCAYEYTEEVEATGHYYEALSKADVESGEITFEYENVFGDIVCVSAYDFATCQNDGYGFEVCKWCGDVKVDYDVEADGESHVWAYVFEGVSYTEVEFIAKIADDYMYGCGDTVVVRRYCTEENCTEGSVKKVEYTAPDHDYLDTSDAEVIEALAKIINSCWADTSIYYLVDGYELSYIREANCEQAARFRLFCANCYDFKTFDFYEGYAQGHYKVYFENTAEPAFCYKDGHSDYWYCLNEGCEYYVDVEEADSDEDGFISFYEAYDFTWDLGYDVIYPATHRIWDEKKQASVAVTFKDVPDERISGAKSASAAQAVEAEDSRYVMIEGTSLVWMYCYDAKDENEVALRFSSALSSILKSARSMSAFTFLSFTRDISSRVEKPSARASPVTVQGLSSKRISPVLARRICPS